MLERLGAMTLKNREKAGIFPGKYTHRTRNQVRSCSKKTFTTSDTSKKVIESM
jgi:hypothetical protein